MKKTYEEYRQFKGQQIYDMLNGNEPKDWSLFGADNLEELHQQFAKEVREKGLLEQARKHELWKQGIYRDEVMSGDNMINGVEIGSL